MILSQKLRARQKIRELIKEKNNIDKMKIITILLISIIATIAMYIYYAIHHIGFLDVGL